MSLCPLNNPILLLTVLVDLNPGWRFWIRRKPLLRRHIYASDFKAV
jgi:hypothetical protein